MRKAAVSLVATLVLVGVPAHVGGVYMIYTAP